MDRNQVTGIILISVLMMVYFIYFGNQQQPTTNASDTTAAKKNATLQSITPAAPDSAALHQKFGSFATVAQGESKEFELENKDIKVTINTHGGRFDKVLLKNYLTDKKKPLYLLDSNNSDISFIVPTSNGDIDIRDLYYSAETSQKGQNNVITLKASLSPTQYIEQVYELAPEGFQLNYQLHFAGLDNQIKNESAKFIWKTDLPRIEEDLEQSRIKSTINYYRANGDFKNLNETSKDEEKEKEDSPIKWVSMKQKFFNAAVIANGAPFQNGNFRSDIVETDSASVKALDANLAFSTADLKAGKGSFQFYFGPNQYNVLKKVTDGFDQNVYLGWPVINLINRFIVVPVFDFLQSFIGNYGVIIIILVLLIKLLLFPLSYRSYISMAKMKVLKPDLDEIKAKYGDDMQKTQAEQMQLYGKVGINPLSGCVPVLLQMPILLAMFNFFPNCIELRQQPFLWAHDLSTYDAPIHLPFTVPFYGDHVSIFTLLMTLSTLLYTYYNNQISTVTGPMKSVSYVMPVVFMFVLNSFPAGLSFYYFVSNLVTIGQQLIIRNFVDEEKIKLTLDENRKKAATGTGKKSKWMQRVEDAMKATEEAKAKQTPKKKK